MIEWQEERVIETNIENVWELFLDENIKRIMPKVEEHTLIEKNEEQPGAKHRQTYREGKRLETYIVDTLAYENKDDEKYKKVSFIIGKAFEITVSYHLTKLDESRTKFIYEGTNKGVNFIGRAMLKFANKKGSRDVVEQFMDRVEQEAVQQGIKT
ncbi:SRPBCC family protein [Halobacillus sp. Marseille-P3879]|uniref:SRPBCC family protein n=1 Tax=Halobacillus sp. Marseille-P3879 TaxID=2045014 RepID=UPI000C7C8372|nr:SRPBCC family protein [Halobacillus sp. Marseille-P3879]